MRVKVINAPGYEDEWSGEVIAAVRTVDGRPVHVIEHDNGGEWSVIPSEYVREPRTDVPGGYMDTDTSAHMSDASLYAECGCIAPCPDHSPKSEGRRDREYWNSDPHGEEQSIVDYAERSVYDDDPDDYDSEDYDDGE